MLQVESFSTHISVQYLTEPQRSSRSPMFLLLNSKRYKKSFPSSKRWCKRCFSQSSHLFGGVEAFLSISPFVTVSSAPGMIFICIILLLLIVIIIMKGFFFSQFDPKWGIFFSGVSQCPLSSCSTRQHDIEL